MPTDDVFYVEILQKPDTWLEKGACKGMPQLFFAPDKERPQARDRREAAARAVCHSCVVYDECLNYVSTNHEYGFWAGMSEEDRHARGMIIPPHLLSYFKREKATSR